MSPFRQLFGLAGWFLVTFAAAAVGGAASTRAAGFYGRLVQPGWAPPAWVFAPVWSTLFALMAIAAWLVWRRGGFERHPVALGLYLVQLALNAAWTWLFFGERLGQLALIDLVALWLLIVATVTAFWRVRRVAGALLLPYLAWVSFAGLLNATLLRLNPGVL